MGVYPGRTTGRLDIDEEWPDSSHLAQLPNRQLLSLVAEMDT